ncbi:MAG: hypothetical protein R3C45_21900 [Phycisphaerales bacterium]
MGYEVINLGRGEPVLMKDFVTIIENSSANPPNSKRSLPASEPKITFANIRQSEKTIGLRPKPPRRRPRQTPGRGIKAHMQ